MKTVGIPLQSDIQATQAVIALFEKSKSQSEQALENLPGIYAVIDKSGTILKGNGTLASLLGLTIEEILGASIDSLFSEANWTQFQSLDISQNNEFSFDLQTKEGSVLNYLWHISELKLSRPGTPPLLVLVGRDVTDLSQAILSKARMEAELQTAKLIQDTLFLPSTATFGSASIAGHYVSATECGGDWWHYSQLGEKVFLWIGDVTGHGVPAAMVVSAIHSAATILSKTVITPSETLSKLNHAIRAMGTEKAMTFMLASVDLVTGECIYASAGHEPIVLFTKQSEPAARCKVLPMPPGLPLGFEKEATYVDQKVQLEKGDRLFFYTDGVYDVANPEGKTWSTSFYRILAPLAAAHGGTKDFSVELEKKITKFRQDAELPDDLTYFVFQL